MKRLLTLLAFAMLAHWQLTAQQTRFQQAVARYKSAATATASVTKTRHNAAIAQPTMSKGTLEMKRPGHVCISTDGGKDMLLMEGSTFTMTLAGKKHTTTSQSSPLFATFQAVFESIMNGGLTGLDSRAGLSITESGQTLVLTISPPQEGKGASRRRTMFSSFVLTIDTRTSALLSLRMNERKGSYTEYTFTNFALR